MTETERLAAIDEWVKTRPECVRDLIEEFPIFSEIVVEGIRFFVVGYNESDSLILWPSEPYERGSTEGRKKYLHADCARALIREAS